MYNNAPHAPKNWNDKTAIHPQYNTCAHTTWCNIFFPFSFFGNHRSLSLWWTVATKKKTIWYVFTFHSFFTSACFPCHFQQHLVSLSPAVGKKIVASITAYTRTKNIYTIYCICLCIFLINCYYCVQSKCPGQFFLSRCSYVCSTHGNKNSLCHHKNEFLYYIFMYYFSTQISSGRKYVGMFVFQMSSPTSELILWNFHKWVNGMQYTGK